MMNRKGQSGQSTIEFILVFAFGVGIVFLVFNSALNSAKGYLVHYATFMASRTYLTYDHHTGDQNQTDSWKGPAIQAARDTFEHYQLFIFDVPSDAFSINEPIDGDNGAYLTVGAKTIFEQQADIIGRILGNTQLELVSESFLGKEPTRAQCANRTCFGITGGPNCFPESDITLYDNGC